MAAGKISPAVRRILAHCFATGGWIDGDDVKAPMGALLSAERRGWLDLERVGRVVISAILTPRAREEFRFPGGP